MDGWMATESNKDKKVGTYATRHVMVYTALL